MDELLHRIRLIEDDFRAAETLARTGDLPSSKPWEKRLAEWDAEVGSILQGVSDAILDERGRELQGMSEAQALSGTELKVEWERLGSERQVLAGEREGLESLKAALRARTRKLDESDRDLRRREEALAEGREGLERREAELEGGKEDLLDKERELDEERAEFAARRSVLDRMEERLAEQERSQAPREAGLKTREDDLDRREGELDGQLAPLRDLERREADLTQRGEALERKLELREAGLTRREEALGREAEERKTRLDEREEKLDIEQARLESKSTQPESEPWTPPEPTEPVVLERQEPAPEPEPAPAPVVEGLGPLSERLSRELGPAERVLRDLAAQRLPAGVPARLRALALALHGARDTLRRAGYLAGGGADAKDGSPLGPLGRCLRRWQRTLRARRVTLRRDLKERLPACGLDPEATLAAFDEIVRNACEAMPRGGRLTVSAARVGGEVEIVFADTGPGIPQERMAEAFTPFRTAKRGHLGLGLPMARRVMESQGGRLSLEKGPGKGTRVRCVFRPAETGIPPSGR